MPMGGQNTLPPFPFQKLVSPCGCRILTAMAGDGISHGKSKAGFADPALIVSIHDVSPATAGRTREILAELEEAGVQRTSLLVVPNHHDAHPVTKHPDFLHEMAEREQAGHEIVLHGYFHQRTRRESETLRQKTVTRLYTADEGEFYDIGYGEARKAMRKGKRELQEGGLTPQGFIAPAWLLGSEAERAAHDEGFEYTTRLTGILDLRQPEWMASQSLVYSVRSSWRVAASKAWNALLARRLQHNPVARLGIHPPDFDHTSVRRQILTLAARLAAKRRVTTYLDWVRDWRNPSWRIPSPDKERNSP